MRIFFVMPLDILEYQNEPKTDKMIYPPNQDQISMLTLL